MLHAHEANAPVFIETDRGLTSVLQAGGVPSTNQFIESLDLRRNPYPGHRALALEHLRLKYGKRPMDLIDVPGGPGLRPERGGLPCGRSECFHDREFYELPTRNFKAYSHSEAKRKAVCL